MSKVIRTFPSERLGRVFVFVAGTICVVALAAYVSQAQKPRATADGDDAQPSFADFKGVRIGMTQDEARKKLGTPQNKSAEMDFYLFGETQAVQVYFDKGLVSAISIDFMNGATSIPSPKDVLGSNAEAKADGSILKLIRYPKAGYWVSYSKTAGDTPTITITMQKIQ